MTSRFFYLIIGILFVQSSLYAQRRVDSTNHMIVYGRATVEQKVDQFSFDIKIKAFGSSVQSALESAQNKIYDLVSVLKKIGYTTDDFQTSQFSEGQSEDKAFLSSKKDFEVNYDIRIKSEKIELLDTTILILNQMKLELSDINLSLKNEFELTKRALEKAVEHAKIKTDIISKGINAKIEEILYIDEDADYYSVSTVQVRGGRSSETAVYLDGFLQNKLLTGFGKNKSFFLSTIKKTVTVKVIYKIK